MTTRHCGNSKSRCGDATRSCCTTSARYASRCSTSYSWRRVIRSRTARSGAEQAFAAFLAERQQVKLYEEALGVLETLATRFILGALTNGNADVYKTDAGDYFHFAFLAEEVGASKPHPDMFHAALERTGVAASNVIHVGDDPEHDIAGARAVGMHTVWMNARGKEWPEGPRPSREISNLRQLPSAIAEIAAAPAKD